MDRHRPPLRATDRRPATEAEAKALASPLRLRILRLCLDQALTNKQLAGRLGRDPGTVLHHVRTLVATGFLAEPVVARLLRAPLTAIRVPESMLDGVALVLALLIATSISMVFGELVPKNLAVAKPAPKRSHRKASTVPRRSVPASRARATAASWSSSQASLPAEK